MSRFGEWWQARQAAKLKAYIQAHPSVAIEAMRQDDTLAAQVVRSHFDAIGMGAYHEHPQRISDEWPGLARMGHGAKHPLMRSLPKITPFALRRFSETPPARKAINALVNPIIDMDWAVEKISRANNKKKQILTSEDELHISIATRCLNMPNDDDGWRVMMRQVLEDMTVGGFGAIELARAANPLRPLFLWPVDGQSIRLNTEWSGNPNDPRYAQNHAYAGISVGTHEDVWLRDDQLIYLRINERTNTPFGLGYLEVAFNMVNAWLGSFDYAERKASNATPNFALNLGKNMDVDKVLAFRRYWEDTIEGYGKTPIFSGDSPSVMDLRGTGTDELYLQWQEMVIRMIAVAFGLSPMTLGLERDVNRNTADAQDSADWDAIRPLVKSVEDYLTRKFLWKALGYHELRFKFLVKDTDDFRQMEIFEKRWEADSITPNEIREAFGEEPLGNEFGDCTKTEYASKVASANAPMGPLGGLPEFGGPPQVDEAGHVVEPPPAPGTPAATVTTAEPLEPEELADPATQDLLQRAHKLFE